MNALTTWSPQQDRAIALVREWLRDPSGAQVFRLFGFAGTGKAQPLDAVVHTPLGPRAMGDLAVGDAVLGVNGRPARVIGVFPQGMKPVYRISFRDGATTRCCGDHLWAVTNGQMERSGAKHHILTTEQLIEIGVRWPSGDRRWRIPLCAPVEYETEHPAFDPYTIGALIGDAHLTGNVIDLACADPEIVDRIRSSLPEGMEIVSRDYGTCPHHVIKDVAAGAQWNRLRRHLEGIGLIVSGREKHIPEAYLFAPLSDRIDLLRGLMDTDGSVRLNNSVNFSTSSPRLADDVVTLVQSLGGTAISKRFGRADGRAIEYQINVKLGICPFHLPRKAARWSPSVKNPPSRFIESIELIGEEMQQCIAVDAPDNLYLTDGFIVTHNTTLAKELAADVKGLVLYATFTGKASLVLRKKGCASASTIHSLIYKADTDPVTGVAHFELNLESDLADAALLVVDEVSMVDGDLARDLLSFNRRILVLGDPAQLPPVKGEGFFINAEPDVMLTEVHRQARDNPIIRMSMVIREGGRLDPGQYGESAVLRRADIDHDRMREHVLASDQLICGLNRTRVAFNRRIRELKNLCGRRKPWHPAVGDRLICLRNNRTKHLFNGGLWSVDRVADVGGKLAMVATSQDEERDPVEIAVFEEFFNGTEQQLDWRARKDSDEFTFGWAITCHKAQGSQYDNPIVFDESGAFRESRSNWLYTAVTRAAERVTVIV